MFVIARAVACSPLFVGLLVYVPARILSRFGVARPAEFGLRQVFGATAGADARPEGLDVTDIESKAEAPGLTVAVPGLPLRRGYGGRYSARGCLRPASMAAFRPS